MKNVARFLQFHLERLLVRGLLWRLVLMAAAIFLVSIIGGIVLSGISSEETLSQGVWWAFLRLTDPGYLGDDQGLARRFVATIITILGMVLFMGALIAILTQTLNETITRLQRGETPIALSGHIVILGNTERTAVVLTEIFRIEPRLERFLARIGRRRDLRVVVLVDELDEEVRNELMSELGELWDDRDIILRSGSPLESEHLDRVNIAEAAAILLPGGKEEDDDLRDATVIKTLLSIAAHPAMMEADERPRVVAELDDARLVDVLDRTHPGQMTLLASDTIVGRLMVQNMRHCGQSWVTQELLASDVGADIYFHQLAELEGMGFDEAARHIEHGVVMGIVRDRPEGPLALLNPPSDERILPGDRLVTASRHFETVTATPVARELPDLPARPAPPMDMKRRRRILVLGWNPRLIAALAELETYAGEDYEVTIMAMPTPEQRARHIERAGLKLRQVRIEHIVGDYTTVYDISRLDLSAYDNLLILGRPNLAEKEQSDARTLMAALIVRDRLARHETRPAIVVELMDPDNAVLFNDVPGEVVLSPSVMGRLLAHVAMRPELAAVISELFTVGGAEVTYRLAHEYGIEPGRLSFAELGAYARSHSEIALGVRNSALELDVSGELDVAPDPDEMYDIDENTRITVLATAS